MLLVYPNIPEANTHKFKRIRIQMHLNSTGPSRFSFFSFSHFAPGPRILVFQTELKPVVSQALQKIIKCGFRHSLTFVQVVEQILAVRRSSFMSYGLIGSAVHDKAIVVPVVFPLLSKSTIEDKPNQYHCEDCK
jgi:hypothetical protein